MTDVHVVPSWQEHDRHPSCWCQPVVTSTDTATGRRAWTHGIGHDLPKHLTDESDPGPVMGGWDVVEAAAVITAIQEARPA